MDLPSGFITQMRGLLHEDADDFLAAMMREPVTSVRLNRRKPGAAFPEAEPVRWCRCGFYLHQRPVFTLDPLLHAGAYYVQDASSMIYHETICRIADILSHDIDSDTTPPLALLDVCAAPGGKTTAMIDALPDGSRVVANEYVAKRAAILRENLAKWGYPDAIVTNCDSSRFAGGDAFDIVAVDAPCSGEGMMRKEKAAIEQWSPQLIEECSSLQKEILENAVKAVAPGGFLIYSTCTFNRRENEENAEFIRSQLGMIPVDMGFPEEWGIPRGIDTDIPAYRFMPHKTEGEGLFLSVFRKPGEWEPKSLRSVSSSHDKGAEVADRKQNPKRAIQRDKGRHANDREKKRKEPETVPEIQEILSLNFDRSRYPEADLTKEDAIAYLRRESITLPPDVPKGLVTVTYRGLPLGMVKNIGNRANNLYPKNWRILMQAGAVPQPTK